MVSALSSTKIFLVEYKQFTSVSIQPNYFICIIVFSTHKSYYNTSH